MTNTKATTARKGATKGNGQRAAANAPQRQGGPAARSRSAGSLEDTIAKAQHGRVNISPGKAVEMAGQLYSRGQFAQAERVCRQIIEARPANADAHNILGVTLAAAGRFNVAVAELKRAIKINPQAPSYHANLGEVLRQAGDLKEAAQALEASVRLDPNNAQALNNLGIIHYEEKKFGEAVEFYRRALELRPNMAEALRYLRQ